MASPSQQVQATSGRNPSRWIQIFLVALALCLLALYVRHNFPFNLSTAALGGVSVSGFPACTYIFAARLFRQSRTLDDFDRAWARWLLGVGLAAGSLGILAMATTLYRMIADRDTDWALVLVIFPVSAFFALTNCILLRRYFGPISPSPAGACREPKLFTVLAWLARRMIGFFSPIRSLSFGSLLVLASVLLATSADFGCDISYYRGYEIITGRGGWITADDHAQRVAPVVNAVGRVTYVAALVCALVALIAVLHSVLRKKQIRLPEGLAAVVGLATVFVFSDLTITFMAPKPPLRTISALWFAYWVLPLMAYSAFGRSRNPAWHRHWPVVRTSLAVLYVPLLIMSWLLVFIFFVLQVYGYPAYFVGLQLLWFGAIQASIADKVPEMRPSFSSAAAGQFVADI